MTGPLVHGSRVTSRPRKETCLVGPDHSTIMLKLVVFPAPLGPSNPTISRDGREWRRH